MRKSLFKSTFVFSLMTVISRVTGLVRELFFAYVFGATAALDVFFVAYRIPNFLRRLFAEGAFSQAFVPVLSEYREKRGVDETKLFLNHMAGLMITVLFAFTVVAVLITPWLVYIFAPGFTNEPTKLELTVSMLRITFPYILFISLTAYVSGILNTYGKFGVPAFTPNLFNLALIGAAVFMAPYFENPVKALAWGVFIGGLAQLLFQLPFLYRLKLMPCPSFIWRDSGVRRVLKLMMPAVFGVSVAQISVLIDTILASFLVSGSVSWLNYSDRLTSFPLGVFGVAIATVILPYLSRKHAVNNQKEFSRTIDWALKFVLIIALPAMIALLMLSGPILIVIFKHGKFSELDVLMSQKSLLGFALGIPAFMLVKVLASVFYSRQDIKTPVKVAIIALMSNIVLAAILIFPLKHAGLALATSLTSVLNGALLFWIIKRNNYYNPGQGWGWFWTRIIIANLCLIVFLWLGSSDISVWFDWHWIASLLRLVFLCIGGAAIYFGCLWLSGVKLREFTLYGLSDK